MATEEKVKKRRAGKIILIIVTILVILDLAAFGGYYYYQYNQLKKKPAEAAQAAQTAEAKQLIKEVAERVELPTGEEPTIYTVQDTSKLKDQAFFAKAQNGDKALIFSKAKIAILYRPSTKKVINVGPINIAQTVAPSVTIIGSQAARDAMETTMNEKLKDKFKLAGKSDAQVEPTEILVVDLTGTNTETVKSFADAIGGKVGTLPEGDTKPAGTDIVVIAK